MIEIKRGLDIPLSGVPRQQIEPGPVVQSIAIVGFDYIGMKPTMLVSEGDQVLKGQPLFADKKTEGVQYTAPAGGTVKAIHRGDKRALQAVVILVDDQEKEISFAQYSRTQLQELVRKAVVEQLVISGLWTALRTRPYSKVPSPDAAPHSIFVTAIDTNPLAADPQLVLSGLETDFQDGLQILSKLTDGKIHLCVAPNSVIGCQTSSKVTRTEFSGSHPAGLVGTHIHFLDPVGAGKTVWSVNYQDVVAIGKLFTTGKLCTDRVISLAGPSVKNPRLIRTRLGANLVELCKDQLQSGENRVISGSVHAGRTADGAVAYLGRYHQQITVLPEGRQREFMRYMSPGLHTHSQLGIYLSGFHLLRNLGIGKDFRYTTNTNGSERAMVPVGLYETVMPLDILPTHLLRYLIVGDTDMAQQLGCLELDEEDLALCTYVCPGKYEFGPILRDCLTRIENEG